MKKRIADMEAGDKFIHPNGRQMIKIDHFKYDAIDLKEFKVWMFLQDSQFEIIGRIGEDGRYEEVEG